MSDLMHLELSGNFLANFL